MMAAVTVCVVRGIATICCYLAIRHKSHLTAANVTQKAISYYIVENTVGIEGNTKRNTLVLRIQRNLTQNAHIDIVMNHWLLHFLLPPKFAPSTLPASQAL
mmetsp:Transcript_29317/g.70746  ORF Transcript_29317/g.70746 Transcript_29317/m.70746 type:complete len:101 (+) Transcript_29317:408-710(+)